MADCTSATTRGAAPRALAHFHPLIPLTLLVQALDALASAIPTVPWTEAPEPEVHLHLSGTSRRASSRDPATRESFADSH